MSDTDTPGGPDTAPVDVVVVDPDRPEVIDRPEVVRRPFDVDLDGDFHVEPQAHMVETRAMDILELAVEVTARPDADPAEVVPPSRRASGIDVRLDDLPRFAPDPDEPDAALDPVPSTATDTVPDTAATTEVDPRIEQRRAEVTSTTRRRRRRRLGMVAALLLVAAAAVGAVYSPILDVDHIEIIGSSQLDSSTLAARTGLRVGEPTLFVDPATVAARLRRDPRFVRVVVARQLPNTVSVRLTDRRPIAVVVGPTRGVVVGEAGVIIAVATGDELLRHVEVSEDPPATPGKRLAAPLAAAVDVMGSMSYEIAVQIEKMRITPEGELVFDLGSGRTVLFGTVDDAERKLLATRTMLGPQIDTRGLCQLDVRVPTAPTIRRNPDCDPPPPPPPPAPDPAAADPAAADPASPTTTAAGATATATPPDPGGASPSTTAVGTD